MKIFLTILIISLSLLSAVQAEPDPEPSPAKGSFYRSPSFGRKRNSVELLRQAPEDADNDASDDSSGAKKPDASTGRLFLKKFLLSSFNSNAQQPVIPIIITGAGNTGTTTSPTVTITSTGTIPTATGTITTTPITTGRETAEDESVGEGSNQGQINVQELQAALAANGQDYVVTDQQVREPAEDDEAKPQNPNFNLRRKNGQAIGVRAPPKYRRVFRNGQQVMVSANRRPGKRRVIKKRIVRNRRRNGNNKNKNNRFG